MARDDAGPLTVHAVAIPSKKEATTARVVRRPPLPQGLKEPKENAT